MTRCGHFHGCDEYGCARDRESNNIYPVDNHLCATYLLLKDYVHTQKKTSERNRHNRMGSLTKPTPPNHSLISHSFSHQRGIA